MTDTNEEMIPPEQPANDPAWHRRQHRLKILLAILIPIVLLSFMYTTDFIPSGSMEPTLKPGDHILTMRTWAAYPFGAMPDRGDIILFRLPKKIQKEDQGSSNDTSVGRKKIGLFRDENGEILIKRVIGLPGESVLINKDGISIDGRQITNNLPIHYDLAALDNGYYAVDTPLKLGNDQIFVLGDNSSLSDDSRYWGPISRKYVVGRFMRILFREGPNGPNEKEVKKGEQN